MNIKGQRDNLLAALKAMTDKPPYVYHGYWDLYWECAYCGKHMNVMFGGEDIYDIHHAASCPYVLGLQLVYEIELQISKEDQCISEQSSSAV